MGFAEERVRISLYITLVFDLVVLCVSCVPVVDSLLHLVFFFQPCAPLPVCDLSFRRRGCFMLDDHVSPKNAFQKGRSLVLFCFFRKG